MSFTSWLGNARSSLAPGRPERGRPIPLGEPQAFGPKTRGVTSFLRKFAHLVFSLLSSPERRALSTARERATLPNQESRRGARSAHTIRGPH